MVFHPSADKRRMGRVVYRDVGYERLAVAMLLAAFRQADAPQRRKWVPGIPSDSRSSRLISGHAVTCHNRSTKHVDIGNLPVAPGYARRHRYSRIGLVVPSD